MVDCASSSRGGTQGYLDTASQFSRDDLMPAFAAWTKAMSEAASARGGDDDNDSDVADVEDAADGSMNAGRRSFGDGPSSLQIPRDVHNLSSLSGLPLLSIDDGGGNSPGTARVIRPSSPRAVPSSPLVVPTKGGRRAEASQSSSMCSVM